MRRNISTIAIFSSVFSSFLCTLFARFSQNLPSLYCLCNIISSSSSSTVRAGVCVLPATERKKKMKKVLSCALQHKSQSRRNTCALHIHRFLLSKLLIFTRSSFFFHSLSFLCPYFVVLSVCAHTRVCVGSSKISINISRIKADR